MTKPQTKKNNSTMAEVGNELIGDDEHDAIGDSRDMIMRNRLRAEQRIKLSQLLEKV